MKRTTATPMLLGAAIALAIATTAIAAASAAEQKTAPAGESSVRVESAGADGGMPSRTAQVPSADYDSVQPAELLPRSGTSLPLIAAISAAFLAIALFVGMRRRRPAPPA